MITKSRKFWLSLTGGLLVSTCFFSYPHVLRWQIEKRIPGVQFQDAHLSTSGVTITGVSLDKGWVKGNLDCVSSDFQGHNITIDGGSLSVNLDARPHGNGQEDHQRNIQFNNLTLKVTKEDHNLSLDGVRSEDHKVCFSGAQLETPSISAGQGCFDRETHTVTVGEANLKQLKIMGAVVTDLVANKITYNTKEKVAEVDGVTAQIIFEKQTFSIETNGVKASRHPDTVTLGSLRVRHPWLASDWITMENVKVQHGERWDLTVGGSHVQVEPGTLTLSGSETCDTWIGSLPVNLKASPLDKIHMTGRTSFSIGFRPKPSFSLKSDCRATCNSLPNLRKPFTYTAYGPKGEKFQRETGPGSKGWVPLRMMGDMPLAVTTMEDPGFEHHRGFITQAFFNSFTDNLKQGRFLRGGSTLTMQLAKNMWLTRDKTLGRKVQEFFLAQGIESCYSKDEIMELYLNIVEFGPNQYGIGSGAQHWFKKGPGELVPSEAFWLASILPRPSKAPPPTDEALKRIEGLMKRLADDGRIPDFSLDVVEDDVGGSDVQPQIDQ